MFSVSQVVCILSLYTITDDVIGNADGLGNIREQELYSSLSVLGVQPDNVNLIENA